MKRVLVLAIAFVLVSGTSFAAGRYVITSTSQIKPSVLRSIEAKAADKAEAAVIERLQDAEGEPIEDSAPCKPGETLVGGGWRWIGRGTFELTGSYPVANEWVVEGRYGGGGGNLYPYSSCRP